LGEKQVDCGICSYCISKKNKKIDLPKLTEIVSLLKMSDLSSRGVQTKTNNTADDVIFVIQHLLEKKHYHPI
jgi:ATP-dependent DNA helicase RecQ